MSIAGALVRVVVSGVRGQGLTLAIVTALVQLAIGIAIMLAAWWGHRYAWAHASPRSPAAHLTQPPRP
jgi:hypothetical protein